MLFLNLFNDHIIVEGHNALRVLRGVGVPSFRERGIIRGSFNIFICFSFYEDPHLGVHDMGNLPLRQIWI